MLVVRGGVVIDYRLPEHRREIFQRFYTFHLRYRSHPGCVYAMLPAIAEAFELNEDGRAWLVWLNGNTQNAVTSYLLLEAAPRPQDWKRAVDFWNEHFAQLEWDTDRRHQKSRFGEATERYMNRHNHQGMLGADLWLGTGTWDRAWETALDHPYMGRLSAWSMLEYARILLGPQVPDAGSWLLEDKSGSHSHRNGLSLLAGHEATYWSADAADMLGIVPQLEQLGDDLLVEARERNPGHPDVGRLTMESALCTFKSWHKPNRRYPNVYADMFYGRIKRAEVRFGRRLDLFWSERQLHLPAYLRLEDNPYDPGLVPEKQNWFLNTGEVVLLHHDFPDMEPSGFDRNVQDQVYGPRKDPKWN